MLAADMNAWARAYLNDDVAQAGKRVLLWQKPTPRAGSSSL